MGHSVPPGMIGESNTSIGLYIDHRNNPAFSLFGGDNYWGNYLVSNMDGTFRARTDAAATTGELVREIVSGNINIAHGGK